MGGVVHTIGHSTHSLEKLTALLAHHGITAVADVRSRPYSRVNPQFNRESLQAGLRAKSIAYAFLGRELGARPEDRSCYVGGKVRYDLLARTPLFQAGLARVALGVASHQVTLLCAERDPLACHRAILVCRHLAARGITPQHILADGRLEGHEAALERLLAELGLAERELFRNHDDAIAEAYARRGQEIAYGQGVPAAEGSISGVGQ